MSSGMRRARSAGSSSGGTARSDDGSPGRARPGRRGPAPGPVVNSRVDLAELEQVLTVVAGRRVVVGGGGRARTATSLGSWRAACWAGRRSPRRVPSRSADPPGCRCSTRACPGWWRRSGRSPCRHRWPPPGYYSARDARPSWTAEPGEDDGGVPGGGGAGCSSGCTVTICPSVTIRVGPGICICGHVGAGPVPP